jgi:hypothetical protein
MVQDAEADVQAGEVHADTCHLCRLEQLRVTLETRVAELTADLVTLEAAITAMRRRYPEVVVGDAYREDVSRAREGIPHAVRVHLRPHAVLRTREGTP